MTGCMPAPEPSEEEKMKRQIESLKDDLHTMESRITGYIDALPPMEIIEGKEDEWKHIVEINSGDEYSEATVRSAEILARVLQPIRTTLKTPEEREQAAFNAICLSDRYGLTGFMVDCIRSLLRKVWRYGTEFFPDKPSMCTVDVKCDEDEIQ